MANDRYDAIRALAQNRKASYRPRIAQSQRSGPAFVLIWALLIALPRSSQGRECMKHRKPRTDMERLELELLRCGAPVHTRLLSQVLTSDAQPNQGASKTSGSASMWRWRASFQQSKESLPWCRLGRLMDMESPARRETLRLGLPSQT